MTDIAPDHLFLRQCLLPVLLRPVVVIMVHHGTAAVVPELRRRHRRALQIPAEVFDATPGAPGPLRKMDLPAASVLRLQIALPLLFIADMPQPRQAAGVNQVITVAQQAGMRSTQSMVQGLSVSPCLSIYLFQESSMVNSNFAGCGIYMPKSIKRDTVPASHRSREAVTLAQ